MSIQQYLASVPDMNVTLPSGQVVVMNHFDKLLTCCYESWYNGENMIVFPGSLKDLYGEAIISYLQHCLQECVGGAVALTTVEDGDAIKTLVEMPKCDNPQSRTQLQISMPSATDTSERGVVKPKVTIAAHKGPPRPMNMWLLYRDAQHKKLKAENPDLSVQEISSICSKSWRNLTPAQKGVWKAAADAGAKEHARLHPGYKYTPRKPGEKKKRQSRKAKQAAAAATVAQSFDVAPVPEVVSLTALDTNIDFGTATGVNPITAGIEFISDLGQFTGPMSFFGLDEAGLAVDSELHDAESLRQFGLQIELEAAFAATHPFAQVAGDTFAFRVGADGDVTLPSINSDDY